MIETNFFPMHYNRRYTGLSSPYREPYISSHLITSMEGGEWGGGGLFIIKLFFFTPFPSSLREPNRKLVYWQLVNLASESIISSRISSSWRVNCRSIQRRVEVLSKKGSKGFEGLHANVWQGSKRGLYGVKWFL